MPGGTDIGPEQFGFSDKYTAQDKQRQAVSSTAFLTRARSTCHVRTNFSCA